MNRLILCLLCICSVALATTYPKLSLEVQLERAELIARVFIKEVKLEERNKRPWTNYVLDIKQYWRGDASTLPQTNQTPSFAIFGNQKTRLEGAPSFKVGEEWIFLLYAKPYENPIVGFKQGAYRLEGNAVFDTDNKAVQLEENGKKVPATRGSFIAALEKILGGK